MAWVAATFGAGLAADPLRGVLGFPRTRAQKPSALIRDALVSIRPIMARVRRDVMVEARQLAGRGV